jgi:hypothetical protein
MNIVIRNINVERRRAERVDIEVKCVEFENLRKNFHYLSYKKKIIKNI